MALTYRSVKGSALTIDEVDNNFRHFTGSHSVTGSLIISGSLIPAEVEATLGTQLKPWKELFVSNGSIVFVSGSGEGQITSSLSLEKGGLISGGFDGTFTGSFTGSADITGSLSGSFTGSADITGSLSGSFSGSIDGTNFYLYNLPTSQPAETGRLWLSGSAASSKFLMVRS